MPTRSTLPTKTHLLHVAWPITDPDEPSQADLKRDAWDDLIEYLAANHIRPVSRPRWTFEHGKPAHLHVTLDVRAATSGRASVRLPLPHENGIAA